MHKPGESSREILTKGGEDTKRTPHMDGIVKTALEQRHISTQVHGPISIISEYFA